MVATFLSTYSVSGIFQAHINLFNLNSDSEIRLVLAPINRVKKKERKENKDNLTAKRQ